MQRSTLANLPLVGGSGQAGSQPSSKGVRYTRDIGMHYTAAALHFLSLSFLSYLVFFLIYSLYHLFGAQHFYYLIIYRRMLDVNSLLKIFLRVVGNIH